VIAALYLRKSSEDERSVDDGKSIERQRQHGIAYATDQGWRFDPDCVFIDEAVSGAEFKNRPGLARMLAALSPKPKFDILILMDQSRLGRDTIRTLGLILTLQNAGVQIHSYLDHREITVDGESDEIETFMRCWSDSKALRDARTGRVGAGTEGDAWAFNRATDVRLRGGAPW